MALHQSVSGSASGSASASEPAGLLAREHEHQLAAGHASASHPRSHSTQSATPVPLSTSYPHLHLYPSHSQNPNLNLNLNPSPPLPALPLATEDRLVSALHAAFLSQSSPSSASSSSAPVASSSPSADQDMVSTSAASFVRDKDREKPHTCLDIAVASDQLYLKGTGVDVEPTLLTGNVVLNLAEPTSIKQINLVFRGKARVPPNPNDPHEWQFLEGEKKHAHTLKAGRHLFPFELRLGGSLPSSIGTYVNGGASVSYKLRATAVRPGLSSNLSATLPISILRTFATESLEYQQTLEIENTWPEKVMYALMIPHKAWAAGDELTALVKFSPLNKGVRVLSITTFLCETTKTLAKSGHLEKTRNIVTRKHEIVHGRAVCVDERRRLHSILQNSLGETHTRHHHHPHLFGSSSAHASHSHSQPHASGSSSPNYPIGSASAFVSGTSTPMVDGGFGLSRPTSHDSSNSTSSNSNSSSSSEEEPLDPEESEISTSVTLPLPTSLTPSHSLDPIIVSYRVRWSILLGNLDGHTSELRCSLPVHILHHSLLAEARKATSATRRLLFGGEDAERDAEEEDAQLPSYSAHVRDRVAIDPAMPMRIPMPEAHALRPYAYEGYDSHGHDSGTTTPMELNLSEFPGFTHVLPTSPPTPGRVVTFDEGALVHLRTAASSTNATVIPPPPAENDGSTESSRAGSRPGSRPGSRHGREGDIAASGMMSTSGLITSTSATSNGRSWRPLSRRPSRIGSRVNSRAASRASSPEHHERDGNASTSTSGSVPSITPLSSSTGVVISVAEPTEASPDATHVHTHNPSSRVTHGLFNAVMKPRTGLAAAAAPWGYHHHLHPYGSSTSVSSSHSSHSTTTGDNIHAVRSMTVPAALSSFASSSSSSSVTEGPGDLLTHVPDYITASRSGGLPPLETLRGLPTYEDSEAQARSRPDRDFGIGGGSEGSASNGASQRSFSDTDLVSLFARARGGRSAARMTPINPSDSRA